MREVYIVGAGWAASGRQGGWSVGTGAPAQPTTPDTARIPVEQVAYVGPVGDRAGLAHWHSDRAAAWRQAVRDGVGQLSHGSLWRCVARPGANPEQDPLADPALHYAALAGAHAFPGTTAPAATGAQPTDRVAVLIGSSKGPFAAWMRHLDAYRKGGETALPGPAGEPPRTVKPRLPSPADFDNVNQRLLVALANRPALGRVEHCSCPVAACSTGLRAVIDACRLIAHDHADSAWAGAADASIHPLVLAAYQRMGVLSPRACCRPWTADADGFFVGEGAGLLRLVTRPGGPASGERQGGPAAQTAAVTPLARPAGPAWRVAGWASAAEATGLAATDATGQTLARLLTLTLDRAGWSAASVTALKPHGTAAPAGDAAEQRGLRALWPDLDGRPVILAKGELGHCLGAAGAVELAYALAALSGPAGPGQRRPPAGPQRLLAWSLGFGGGAEAIALEWPS